MLEKVISVFGGGKVENEEDKNVSDAAVINYDKETASQNVSIVSGDDSTDHRSAISCHIYE